MSKSLARRLQRKPRQEPHYSGESAGTLLADLLNTIPKNDRYSVEGSQEEWKRITVKDQIADRKIIRRLVQILQEEGAGLDAFFSRVCFVPRPSVRTREIGQRHRLWDWKVTANGRQLRPAVRHAILCALDLANTGLIHRLRRCRQCSSWFYAKIKKHFHCSNACRDRHFRTTPEGKEKRRRYMQTYRKQPSHKAIRKTKEEKR
jgi:hypothetical protein